MRTRLEVTSTVKQREGRCEWQKKEQLLLRWMDGVERKGNMQGQYHFTAVACQQVFMQPALNPTCNTIHSLVYTKNTVHSFLVLPLCFFQLRWSSLIDGLFNSSISLLLRPLPRFPSHDHPPLISQSSLPLRWWTGRPARPTHQLCVSRENASKRAVMANWTPTRSLTSVACVAGTTKAARKSQECSPNPCE